jgi:hypothetical protein
MAPGVTFVHTRNKHIWRRVFFFAAIIMLPSFCLYGAFGADEVNVLRSPYGGFIRGLVIGIDTYRHVKPLKGAVADARDIDDALRKTGVQDVTFLTNARADRSTIIAAFNSLIERTRSLDLVIITLAGHGAQEPERVRGTQPDGIENVFLLPGFENSPAGSQERILGAEFNHFIRQLEQQGAHVLFVADACFGGGMTRDIDPRSEEMSFRQVPSYRLSSDLLRPVTTTVDEHLSELDFDRTTFLAAVDRKTKAPEVEIPGIPGLRGALSYAVARAIEGYAANRKDGRTTLRELFGAVRQMVYQLSNERQNIVTSAPPSLDLNTEVIFEMTRTVTTENAARPLVASAANDPQTLGNGRPIKISSLDGNSSHFTGLKSQGAPFELVRPVEHPDLIWDPASHDVLAWGDVVAYGVETKDLPDIIDRTSAVRALKMISGKAPQSIKVTPDDGLHRNSTLVNIEVSDIAGRSLILFDIAGDGTIQALYPSGSDSRVIQTTVYSLPVRVRKPFGSDQLVAITSLQQMPALEQAVRDLNNRKSANKMVELIKRFAPADARIGSAGLFTAP